ncbi:MAG: serine/threonine-protein kinase, partial [Chthoniobacterales bacterium]
MSDLESPQQILQACSACGALLDVSDEIPFGQIYCPSCGQALRARTQFNNFTLLELLGEGGMGSVLKAVDLNLQREVALKILKKECSANLEERQRLETEARITASINHPHVVKVYSFGEDHGQFYLAMELVEKGSLDDLMTIQRRVAEAQVLEVGIQIAQGLEAASEKGLIHRDVKPGNILFADAHTAKIVDFGLALALADEAAQRGEVWGTPYYIAPEKLNNEPEDFRSDMYSLGGTLFHALAG